ncbi:MAG TPA: hypothetical protein VL400_20415 [Polyangiaceae bacterium]|jgi:hypothetical protein|nr:hypothetical protein [Polyangiaceae bacterium]
MQRPLSKQSYDAKSNILEVAHPSHVKLATSDDIAAYFDDIHRFWRTSCAGNKAYYLVDWDGFEVNPRETDAYANAVKRIASDCAITIVRFGSNPLQRTLGRLVAVKIHHPSNVYDTKAEALGVIAGLKSGAVTIGSVPPASR